MEKHTCKLCSRRFSNGRALGGHMRSHVVGGGAPAARTQLSSASSASTSVADEPEEDEDEDEDEGRSVHGGLGYVLRENPRKSFRLVDPQFSSSFASAAAAADAGSCSVVQDRESDNESPRAAAAAAAAAPGHHRRRSKRPRGRAPPSQEAEQASSVSDATPEEDVALSLMMLSRDSWTNPKSKSETEQSFNHHYYHHYYSSHKEEEEKQQEEEGGGGGGGLRQSDGDDCEERARRGASRAVRSRAAAAPKSRSRYQCGACKKTFRSYQALGGHRASHKKGGVAGCCCFPAPPPPPPPPAPAPNAGGPREAHACPFCPRVFASAQALGGHKRAHLSSSSSPAAAAVPPPPPPPPPTKKLAGSFGAIDLNLPAPADDEFELSAVSDADFGPYN